MKKILLSLALLAATGSSFAAPEIYVIDPTHTFPVFEYNHFGLSKQKHGFDKTSGQIVLDREARTASVDVVIDAKSVNTGIPVFNGHLQDEDFFDTAKYDSIRFKSTRVKFEGDQPVAVEGELTLKGVTKPVTLTITHFTAQQHPMMKKDAVGANATATIKRSDFNMGKFAPYVSDEITLYLAVEAIKP
ncbi:MAG: polyisoprenoid-binding protein [Candidatus Dactylopiibacterium carminicum]|uniref:Polyisoprenoid-binding protein n=1 Tax=Candidatus Dactylopiibacterium carminicum TaxID=857335 RepID=A0A272ESW7_9RHOO|nr:YceI family protein [Candidatus Dactylopiibacterium carminicum]KAF7600743.1 polyisoprenoid-binding protein [Candidatus Dactylopiibacterium carminicum]PAS93189.1 MAG: polyisoprenoid-binding protein [Candidatus Dactylopiibacterium carminicum]PAS95852.1 MAG: polyisoprenoid-binding protein [Candidatus Dactylopiibacterium carminicum]PAT00750.1 MAG: polyisoprenoid-binding protein [Candidatus Dactylopiibacterium carminicum]